VACGAFPTSRIVTIPIGTECPDPAPREERRGRLVRQAELESLGPVLLHVGSFTPEKNQRWLVEAFAAVAERRPDARRILIGEGPLMPETRAVIERLGIGHRVRMLGAREVPTVAWDVGGVAEVIEDSPTGYVVPAGDGKAFIGRVLELIDDAERARGMGEAARAWVCAGFDLPGVAGAFERLYRDHAR